jgi:hypothetical protein
VIFLYCMSSCGQCGTHVFDFLDGRRVDNRRARVLVDGLVECDDFLSRVSDLTNLVRKIMAIQVGHHDFGIVQVQGMHNVFHHLGRGSCRQRQAWWAAECLHRI